MVQTAESKEIEVGALCFGSLQFAFDQPLYIPGMLSSFRSEGAADPAFGLSMGMPVDGAGFGGAVRDVMEPFKGSAEAKAGEMIEHETGEEGAAVIHERAVVDGIVDGVRPVVQGVQKACSLGEELTHASTDLAHGKGGDDSLAIGTRNAIAVFGGGDVDLFETMACEARNHFGVLGEFPYGFLKAKHDELIALCAEFGIGFAFVEVDPDKVGEGHL
jgi:hypothetical protein